MSDITDNDTGSSDESTSRVASGGTVAPRVGKLQCDCDPGEVSATLSILVCKGATHKLHRRFHAECVGESEKRETEGPWLCEWCESHAADAQSQGPSQPVVANPGGPVSLDKVLDQRVDPDPNTHGDVLQYYIRDDADMESWVNEEDVDDGLKAAWERGWRVTLGDDEDFIAKAIESSSPHDDGDAEDHEDNGLLRNEHWDNLHRGYWSLAASLYDTFVNHRAVKADKPTRYDFRVQLTQLLAPMPFKLLEAICGRGLRWTRLRDANVRWALETMRNQSSSRPLTYMLELVNKVGHPPTIGEMWEIIDWANRYILLNDGGGGRFSSRIALEIDEACGALDPDERELVLNDEARAWFVVKSKKAKKRLQVLINAIIERLNEAEEAGLTADQLCTFILRDVGYTSNGVNRIENQQKVLKSVNKAMALFASICKAFLPEYSLHGDVVHLCTDYWQAPWGEIAMSLLAPSYHYTGKGFNTVEAANQQNSMKAFNEAKEWTMWKNQMLNDSPFYENMAAERLRIEHHGSECTRLEAEAVEQECANLRTEIALVELTETLRQQIIAAKEKLLAND